MDSRWWHMAGLKCNSEITGYVLKLRLNELTDGEMWIFRGMAFHIGGEV